jgi:hypothetical protein
MVHNGSSIFKNDEVRINIALNVRRLILDRYTVDVNEDVFLNDLVNIVKIHTT